jgi:hypothetical protein
MTIPFTCPHCGRRTDVDARYAGQTGPCVECGRLVTIPAVPTERRGDQAMFSRDNFGLAITMITAGVALVAVIVLATMRVVYPALQEIRHSASLTRCQGHLEQIAMALLAYEAEHGHFPPAAVTDSAGQPMHSWRVLILPYLGPEEQALYSQYNLAEPWDGPTNIGLVNQMPSVFRCEQDDQSQPGETSYLVVSGRGMVFDGAAETPLADLRQGDGPEQTLLVVEAVGSGIAWTQPKDVDAVMLGYGINSQKKPSVRGPHSRQANVALADGTVVALPIELDAGQLRGLATVNGQEPAPARLRGSR